MKSLSNITRGLIRKPVGNNLANEEKDVMSVKKALGGLGRFEKEEEPHGIITRTLDDSIKDFQRDKGLRVDGRIRPGGETETAIKEEQTEQEKQQQEERKKQEEKRRKCAALSVELQNERLQLERLDVRLSNVLAQINPAQKELREAQEALRVARGKQMLDTVTSINPGKKIISEVLKGGAMAASHHDDVRAAEERVQRAEEKFKSLQLQEQDLNRWITETDRNITDLKSKIVSQGC